MLIDKSYEAVEGYKIGFRGIVEVSIVKGLDGKLRYFVREPDLTSFLEELRRRVVETIFNDVEMLKRLSSFNGFDDGYEYANDVVYNLCRKFFGRKRCEDSKSSLDRVVYYVLRDFVGYGEIDPFIRDPEIEDITCDGVGRPIHVFHRRYEWLETNVALSPERLNSIVKKLAYRADREVSIAQPIVEGILRPEGYRVHIVLDIVSTHGHSFTVRKYRERPFSIVELINSGMLDPGVASLVWLAAENKQGIVFYGPTGSGKTTLLNAVAMLLPSELKIVSAEDTQEIRLPFHENWMSMVSRLSSDPNIQNVTLQAQVEAAMRQRPDVLILGEIRSREAYSFFQAVSTGHGGLTTIHAENVESLIRRLSSPPMNVPVSLIASAKLFVQIQRLLYRTSIVRKVTYVHEIWDYDPATNRITIKLLCKWDRESDSWLFNLSESRLLKDISQLLLTSYEDILEDLVRRATLLLYAVKKEMDVIQIHSLVRRYRRDPVTTYLEAVKFVEKPYRFRIVDEIEKKAI
ncbi:MAG: type II/IV secretion system ATPase subunit [Ignisphaera sp.]